MTRAHGIDTGHVKAGDGSSPTPSSARRSESLPTLSERETDLSQQHPLVGVLPRGIGPVDDGVHGPALRIDARLEVVPGEAIAPELEEEARAQVVEVLRERSALLEALADRVDALVPLVAEVCVAVEGVGELGDLAQIGVLARDLAQRELPRASAISITAG